MYAGICLCCVCTHVYIHVYTDMLHIPMQPCVTKLFAYCPNVVPEIEEHEARGRIVVTSHQNGADVYIVQGVGKYTWCRYVQTSSD
jgi:hypothetical protein